MGSSIAYYGYESISVFLRFLAPTTYMIYGICLSNLAWAKNARIHMDVTNLMKLNSQQCNGLDFELNFYSFLR